MHLKLKVLRGGSAGKEIAVQPAKFIIGRSEECNLRANSDAISRRHCAIVAAKDGVFIQDLGSRNGTIVNGNAAKKPHKLQVGDQVRVGPLEFLVTYVREDPSRGGTAKASDSNIVSDDDMAGMVSDWLSEEHGDTNILKEPETREYQSAPAKEKPAPVDDVQVELDQQKSSPSTSDTQNSMEKKDQSDTQKIPKAGSKGAKKAPKDTQEAAAQMLRKFFNRS